MDGTGAIAQSRSLFFPSSRVPSANGMYLANAQSFGMSPTSVVISNLVLRGFTQNLPAPPLGTSAKSTFQAQVEFDYSLGGGAPFTHGAAQAIIAVLATARQGAGTQQIHDTEMLQLDLTGNLPGLMIRESPTLPSRGQLTAGPTGGGFLVSSFFDVFLEVSTDNGQTWQPLDPPQHLDLRVDPATVAAVPEPSPLWPPPDDQLVMAPQNVVIFTGGVRVKGLRQTLFSEATDATAIAINPSGLILPYIEQVDLQLSLNDGQTFMPMYTSGSVTVAVQKVRESPFQIFDKEMLQLDISGNLPGGGVVMIRESPTLPSFGGLSIQPLADGSFTLNSFFDVFLELSTDGGQTWRVADNGAVRLEVQGNGPRNRFSSPNFPTPGGQYLSQAGMLQSYQAAGSSVLITSEALLGFSSSAPPPAAGQTLNQPFNGQMNLRMSLDGGLNFTSITATASGALQVRRSSVNWDNTSFFDTEMLQLNLTGLPAGVMIRESPTLASRGRTSIKPDAAGYRMDSFFDIFTELSLDGGQTWSAAAEGVVSSALHPTPVEAPLRIFCPSNITIAATSSSGAVVNYLPLAIPGDCPLGTAISSCSPPSGSVFPIGTTTVTCEAHNACGEHVSCTFLVTVTPSLPQISDWVFARGLWPPLNGMYLSPAHFGRVIGAGVILSNVTLRSFSRNAAPPQPGGSLTLPLGLTVELDWSTGGGGLFTHGNAPARMLVSLQDDGPGSVPGQEIHNAEILSFDLSGGNLPGGLMIRESPTRPSTGQIGMRPLPFDGGFMINSFFDVFTEVSRDGGQTWLPTDQPLHVELRVDPTTQIPVPEFAPLFPPPDDQLASPPESMASFTGGVRIKNVRNKLFSQSFDASLLGVSGTPVTQQFDSQIYLQWSLDNGATFTSGRVPASLTVAVQKVREAASHVFDTEMLQLDISGGDLPPSVRIRESPTLPSHGQIALEPTADGTFYMSSFFDVFIELSADGGQTWQPAIGGPVHLELQGNSLRSRFASPKLPPFGGRYEWPGGTRQAYQWGAAGVLIAANTIGGFTESSPPPAPGQSLIQSFASQVDLQVSTDGGQTFNPYRATGSAQMRITGNAGINWGDRQYFDTEMLSLNISGGNLPNGVMIRESPTRASLGRTAMRPDGANAYRLDSFFDIFTELSLDGGQSWVAALDGSATSALFPDPSPPFAPYVITCPSNLTVYASSPSGVVVNYSLPPLTFFPDCPFCCFTATCMPPSGSLFPIGTTTVNCVGHDGCGETPTCSFTVTVLQPFIYGGLLESILGSAVLNIYHAGTGAPASLVVSNLGPSGADGFHVNLGAADSLVFNFQPFPTTVQTCIVSTATGPYAFGPSQVLGTSTYLGGSNPIVRADFSSIGATSLVAQVRDENRRLVSSSLLANNDWLDINALFPPGCTNPTTTVYTYWQGPDYSWWRFCRYGCNCIGTNCYTERVICFRAVLEPAVRPLSLSSIDLRSQGVNVPSALTIMSMDIGRFGNLHETTGDATFESGPGVLAVNNLGSSGQDGVAVNLNRVGKFDMTLAPTRLMGAGVCLDLSASGDVNGLPAVQLGSVSLAGDGGTLLIDGNFNGLGATMVRVEIYQGSELQGGITLPAGALGQLKVNGNLIGCGTLSQPTPGLWARFDSTFSYVDPNNRNLFGDQIRIHVANPAARVRGLTRFAVQACNIGQFAILDESMTPLIGDVSRTRTGGVFITGQGVAGRTYRLEATPNLGAQTSWKTVDSAEADVDGTFELDDLTTASQQFYRTVTP